jgi:hypothetical protein
MLVLSERVVTQNGKLPSVEDCSKVFYSGKMDAGRTCGGGDYHAYCHVSSVVW